MSTDTSHQKPASKSTLKNLILPAVCGLITAGAAIFLVNNWASDAAGAKVIAASPSDFATIEAAEALARKLADDQSNDWPMQLSGITQIPDPEHIDIVRTGLLAGKRYDALCMVKLTDESTTADYQVALALAKGEARSVCIPHGFQIQQGGEVALQLDTMGLLPAEVRVAGIRLDLVRNTWS